MRLLARLGSLRTVVAVLTAITGVQMALIVFGNITDFDTNLAFVQHVLAMDTTFKSPNTMWRAITGATVATAVYLLIIGWESLTAVTLIAATVAWVRSFAGRPAEVAQRLSTLGWLLTLVLFVGGFITIGGEWFEMWQSSKWNGLQAALQNVIIAVSGLVLAHLPVRDPQR